MYKQNCPQLTRTSQPHIYEIQPQCKNMNLAFWGCQWTAQVFILVFAPLDHILQSDIVSYNMDTNITVSWLSLTMR